MNSLIDGLNILAECAGLSVLHNLHIIYPLKVEVYLKFFQLMRFGLTNGNSSL